MKVIRSFIFIPADKKRMLDKISLLLPDAFILDLEDSVPCENKKIARSNIASILESLEIRKKIIFIRLNDSDSNYIYEDIDETIGNKIYGYMIPKFEKIESLEEIINYLSSKERELNLISKLKLIVMIESSKGLLELHRLNNNSGRIIGLALGAEDYKFNLSEFGMVSEEMVDFARKIIIQYSKANDILSIDTVFRDYNNIQGLQDELKKIKGMGFSSKLAIHPSQIEIINSSFTPSTEEINKAEIILKHKDELKKNGAISIEGVMYDLPHLKWAQKIKNYLIRIKED